MPKWSGGGGHCLGQNVWRNYSIKVFKEIELQIGRTSMEKTGTIPREKSSRSKDPEAFSLMLSGGGVVTTAKSSNRE